MKTYIELPTLEYRDEITAAVDGHQVVILTAETGAGKSTQVPQYLAEHGYDRVVVTQPRILAARNLCKRVREEWSGRNNEDASQVIGYRTAHERDDSGQAKILYCTDGLQMVRELTGSGVRQKQILILDEVHEWNENMEVLVAWAKKRCTEDPGFKVLVMSATIETESLAEYYGTSAVINMPGRYFPVTKRLGTDVIHELSIQLDQKTMRNVLTFLPGKSEIQNTMEAIAEKAAEAGAPIIPLHSQLELEDQQKAFHAHPRGKIILATNIAQTSVTIDDIDMVIDSGLERRSEVRSGVEGLFVAQISQADSLQRAGRAGRTRPGEYVLAPYDDMPCLAFEDRPPYPTPEILRKHIDRLVLRLASIGMDIEELDFYHDPSKGAIRRAKRTLVSLGALTRDGQVTDVGRAMERFPVESSYGRMLVEVQSANEAVRSKLATMIAIQEVGGIVRSSVSGISWRSLTSEERSDFFAQYDVFVAALELSDDDRETMGIITKQIDKAAEVRERLHRDLSLPLQDSSVVSAAERVVLVRAIVAGQLHNIWQINEHKQAEHVLTGDKRSLSKTTVVNRAKLFVGVPFDLEVPMRGGELETLHLVQNITEVSISMLAELMPRSIQQHPSAVYYDSKIGSLAVRERLQIGKKILLGSSQPVADRSPQNQELFVKEYAKWAHGEIERRRHYPPYRHRRLPKISLHQIERLTRRHKGVISLSQLPADQKEGLLSLARLDTYINDKDTRPHPRYDRLKRKNHKWQRQRK